MSIFQMLEVLGRQQNAIIYEIKRCLWSAVIDLAKGEKDTVGQVMAALVKIQQIILLTNVDGIKNWFAGEKIY